MNESSESFLSRKGWRGGKRAGETNIFLCLPNRWIILNRNIVVYIFVGNNLCHGNQGYGKKVDFYCRIKRNEHNKKKRNNVETHLMDFVFHSTVGRSSKINFSFIYFVKSGFSGEIIETSLFFVTHPSYIIQNIN
jgi:hypothetical protein